MVAKIVYGKTIAQSIEKDVAKNIQEMKETFDFSPKIVTVMVGENPESLLYLNLRDKACKRVGIHSERITLAENTTEKQMLHQIRKLNEDSTVHGVLVQLPLPDQISSQHVYSVLSPLKDVEGFTSVNLGSLLNGEEYIIPCTPLGVLKILEHEKTELKGKNVAVVNHSTVVGKPLSILFLNRNATVSVSHVHTSSLKQNTKRADVLVSAAGVAGLITADYVKSDAFVIDVGIISTDEGITGDVDQNSVKQKAGKLTPVPGGVGPVTVACSLLNMIKTIRNCVKV